MESSVQMPYNFGTKQLKLLVNYHCCKVKLQFGFHLSPQIMSALLSCPLGPLSWTWWDRPWWKGLAESGVGGDEMRRQCKGLLYRPKYQKERGGIIRRQLEMVQCYFHLLSRNCFIKEPTRRRSKSLQENLLPRNNMIVLLKRKLMPK